jgi:hypothetical protein
MPIVVLIEGDMLKQKMQVQVDVKSLEEFKTEVAKVAKIRIEEFDLLVFNMVFGEWCAPIGFDGLGESVKVKLVAKQHDANAENFAIEPENFNKFLGYVSSSAPSPVILATHYSLLGASSRTGTTRIFKEGLPHISSRRT